MIGHYLDMSPDGNLGNQITKKPTCGGLPTNLKYIFFINKVTISLSGNLNKLGNHNYQGTHMRALTKIYFSMSDVINNLV